LPWQIISDYVYFVLSRNDKLLIIYNKKKQPMKNNILFLDCTQNIGYEFSAANTKVEMIVRGLIENGDNCAIINGLIGYKNISKRTVKSLRCIPLIITYSRKYNEIISWIFNLKALYEDLRTCKVNSANNIVVLELPDYHIFITYVLLSKILKYKIVVIAQEWGPTLTSLHWIRKPSLIIYSKTFGYFVNGIFPISEFIINKIKHFNIPYMKLPILSDFNNSDILVSKTNIKFKYFLYCVFAIYTRVIYFIIDVFHYYLNMNNEKKLILVLSGDEEEISLIENYIINLDLACRIIIKSKLPYSELLSLYKNADALLIPLDPNHQQDEARFSQKIAEYLSSGTPIISNNVGEIKYYFEDKVNVILASDYTVLSFYKALIWVDENPIKSKDIGLKGYELGRVEFDYRKYGKMTHDFILKI